MRTEIKLDTCELLEWDSAFFGRRIGQIRGNVLTNELIDQIRACAYAQAIDCLYFFGRTDDYETVRLAEKAGLSLVDIRTEYKRRIQLDEDWIHPEVTRFFKPDDLPELAQIAQTSHTDSRFYFDGNFSRAQCDRLFKTWIQRSCSGWADGVLVAVQHNAPAGYLTCHCRPNASGHIGLLAVSDNWRCKGLGMALVQSALSYFHSKGISDVSVVTQGRNGPSQRLYQRSGFLTSQTYLTYHWWL